MSPKTLLRILTIVLGWVLGFGCYAEPKSGAPLDFSEGGSVGHSATSSNGGGGRQNSSGTGDQGTGDDGSENSSGTGNGGDASDGLSTGGDLGFGGIVSTDTDSGSDSGGTSGSGQTAACEDAVAEPLPARKAIIALEGGGTTSTDQVISITKEALFREFERQTCGNSACHGGEDAPNLSSPDVFKMTLNSFDQRADLGTASLARILSSDPDEVMPPGSGDGSGRAEDNPVRRLGERLLAWQQAGFPDAFDILIQTGNVSDELPEDPYLLSQSLGNHLTNIGSCIPHTSFSMTSSSLHLDDMREKDEMFAALEDSDGLPQTLVETDLVSLDSTTLALRGVYSYAPAYTLFSDHAGKMRHVRVPVGETIRYNPETKDFDIPDNTRFYKTFLKEVRDAEGNLGYRKMETRLIVVRRDEQLPDGSFRPRALRATYAWDLDETMALRVRDPLRNGEPFADRLCPYVVDESVTRDPTTNPVSEEMSEFCSYMTAEQLADPSSGQIRHYGIPSAQRCDQCHMGSNSRSYILGFNPWQIDRRPEGEGGVYEPATDDELSQLARFLAYGIVSGIEPGEAKLEESQGDRVPRNEYELRAQGYMLGNCAFCHNEHGFPVVQNPVLESFDLFPDEADGGGIFQFPLERYSPRAKAGRGQAARFPYITAAFGDLDLAEWQETSQIRKVKLWSGGVAPPVVDFEDDPVDFFYEDQQLYFEFLGPWRSLIWRNVYTPFTYDEDNTIFVHMPRNAPGYDCRAHNIMADWMLSIPTVAKQAVAVEQPVVEVFPGEDGYEEAVEAGQARVEAFHLGVTGQHCPIDDDIVDPKVILSPVDRKTGVKTRPSPEDDGILYSERLRSDLEVPLLDRVPDHAHWVPTDTTDFAGDWVPRRLNWKEVIATREVQVESDKLNLVIDDLQNVHLSPEQEAFSLEPLPMGLWSESCQDSEEAEDSPTVEDLLSEPSEPLRRWLTGVFEDEGSPAADRRVHFRSRGEAVFQGICQNCHGREADSRSPLAATILELTGGQTRVANFVDGLFGPKEAPGAFARDEFMINMGASDAEWQVRYMLFMGLGGTQSVIPRAVLNLVATSPFYGIPTTAPGGSDPNMLDSAVQLCGSVLSHRRELSEPPDPLKTQLLVSGGRTPFARGAGHYELWESLCAYGNAPVVRVFVANVSPPQANSGSVYRAVDDSGNLLYPADHPVGNQNGEIEFGISPDNSLPWCIEARNEAERDDVLELFYEWDIPEDVIPFCPSSLLAEAFGQRVNQLSLDVAGGINPNTPLGNQDFTARWMRHGAMNAGIAAYYYLNNLTTGALEPSQPFDVCGEEEE